MTDKDRVEELRQFSGLTWRELAAKVGVHPQTFTDIRGGRHGVSKSLAAKIMAAFPDLRQEWVVFGSGPMTKKESSRDIPLYEGSGGSGGALDASRCAGAINVGSCFPHAEMALRYTGEAMSEYPSGCILILRRVCDADMLVPGSNYVVETREFTLPKRLQTGSRENRITLYSTSAATYPDGRLVHEPFEIPMDSVMRVFAILGYIYSVSGEVAQATSSRVQ